MRPSAAAVGQHLLVLAAGVLEHVGQYGQVGISLEPIPGPTALALLALQGRAGDPRVAASVTYLCRQAGPFVSMRAM